MRLTRKQLVTLIVAVVLVDVIIAVRVYQHFSEDSPAPSDSPAQPDSIHNPPVEQPLPVEAEPEQNSPDSTPPPLPAPDSPSRPALFPPDPASLAPGEPHPDAVSFGSPSIPPEKEADILFSLLNIYRQRFGAFPAGQENAHIINALRGNNPASLGIFPHQHPRLDQNGNLLDAWGSPFFFHAISSGYIEVRSPGPDRILYTTDDLLAPPPRPFPTND